MLLRASRWVDLITQQRHGIAASTNQDPPTKVRASRDGTILYQPLTFPIVAVVMGQWWYRYPGAVPTKTAIDTTMVTVLDRTIELADTWCYARSRAWGAPSLFVQLEYENGYAHTTMTSSPLENATTFTVASTIGMSGTAAAITTANVTPYLRILDGAASEDIVVQSVSGSTLTLASGLLNEHSAGAIVTGIPMDVQQSTIDLAAYLIKTRDAGGITMDARGFGENESAPGIVAGQGLDETMKRLIPYTRVGAA